MPKSREVSIKQRGQVLSLQEAGNLMGTIFIKLHIPRSREQKIINRLVKPEITV